MELLPIIWKTSVDKKELIMLAFKARCTYLDIVDIPPPIDRVLAHVITKFLDVEHGVGATDITRSSANNRRITSKPTRRTKS